jgi:hypothetical protein
MKPHPNRRRATVLILFAAASLSLTPARADEAEAKVKDIRERYNRIESAKFRAKEMEFTSNSDPISGTFTRYYLGDTLVKIKLSYGMGDHGGSEEYYYYDHGELFFAFATDSAWGFTGETLPNGEGTTIDTAIEHRAYFFNGALVRHLSREAKSKDAAAIPKLLQKAQNQASSDSDRATRLYSVGTGAYNANDGAGILGLLID